MPTTHFVIWCCVQFGFGGEATSGGQEVRDAVVLYHKELFPGSEGKLARLWMPAYKAGVGTQKQHADTERWRVRTVYGATSDGSPRRVGVVDTAGGRVWATVIGADGGVEELLSAPGEELVLDVPSGGFYTMTGPGSGAQPDELAWEHEPKIGDADAVALIVDHYASLTAQQGQMAAAAEELARRGKQRVLLVPLPAKHNLRQVIDYDTKELDKSEGVIISINHYW